MPKPTEWAIWEKDVQEALGLDATISSGNQWHDKGDASDNRHPSQSGFRILADAKWTGRASYTLQVAELAHMVKAAASVGKRFILPVRFRVGFPRDYVVLSFEDFCELVEKARD